MLRVHRRRERALILVVILREQSREIHELAVGLILRDALDERGEVRFGFRREEFPERRREFVAADQTRVPSRGGQEVEQAGGHVGAIAADVFGQLTEQNRAEHLHVGVVVVLAQRRAQVVPELDDGGVVARELLPQVLVQVLVQRPGVRARRVVAVFPRPHLLDERFGLALGQFPRGHAVGLRPEESRHLRTRAERRERRGAAVLRGGSFVLRLLVFRAIPSVRRRSPSPPPRAR